MQINLLRMMVDEYRGAYAIRSRARDIIFRQYCVPPREKEKQALALADWVQRNITYVEEKPEVFQTPLHTVATGYGDCDDFVTLIAALCESVGIDCELVGMEWEGEYRHIFPRAVIKGRRVPLDATLLGSVYDKRDPIDIALGWGVDLTCYVG